MSELYELFNYEKFNKSKKTIVAFMLDVPIKKNTYNITTKYFFNTLRLLSNDFNILIISRNSGTNWINTVLENEELKNYMYFCFDTINKTYYSTGATIQSHDQKVEYITTAIKEFELDYKELFNSFTATIMSHMILPSLDLNFELLSYGNEDILKKQIKSSNGYISRIQRHKLISHTAFIYKPVGFGIEFLFYLMKNYPDLYYYAFCHESSSTWLQHTKKYNPYTKNVKCFYFVDQNFENREFYKFPLCQMQDFLNNKFYDKSYYENILNNKSNDFVFGGLFPYKVSQRVNAWYKYFDNLNINGKIRTQVDGKTKIDKKGFDKPIHFDNELANKLYNDIKKNKLVTNTLPYDEYNKDLQNSMFTIMVQSYYGKSDNLTLRFMGSFYNGVIPLITEEYDPHNLQIPKYFRDKLLIKSHTDIEEKCQYYKTHYDEYKKLFFELYDYYINSKYFTDDYYINEFKSNLFKEIY